MELQHINLDQLIPAKLNVRKKGRKKVGDLLPSIRAHGVLQPLLVRPSGDQFEIVAGQRRYHALVNLAEEQNNNDMSAPCMVMEAGDNAKAIEASLAENLARLPMDEIDQYKAFAALVKQGEDPSEIASRFGITEKLVRQRLAIANLINPILTLYSKGEIHAETLRLLTMASKAQQKAWLELYRSEDEYAPEGYRLKCWLFGGAEIPVSHALFDLDEYDGAIVSDLFGDECYFDNAETFWHAQNSAIASLKESYETEGWSDVIVLDVGEYFPAYEYVRTSKKDGGKVYIALGRDGEVTCYEGQLSRKDIKEREQSQETDKPSKAVKCEITKGMQNYLDLHRHSAVRTALLQDQKTALRIAIAQIIAGSSLWSVKADSRKANSSAIADSLTENKAEMVFAEERQAVMETLEIKADEGEDNSVIVPTKDDWDVSRDFHSILSALFKLDDDSVMRVLTFVVAECLPCGTSTVEMLGERLEVSMGAVWHPDQAFFDLMRDKRAINAMVSDIAGEDAAKARIGQTAKEQKALIQTRLAETEHEDWLPRYMAFPMTSYLRDDGIRAIEDWACDKSHYAGQEGK